MECPKCQTEIGNVGYCGCGWKRTRAQQRDEPRAFVQCAHMACNTSAVVREKTPTGLADFCPQHYSDYHLAIAEATCKRLGLATTEQKRAWVREKMKTLTRRITPDYQREPGEDWDEPITAAQPQGDSQHGNT